MENKEQFLTGGVYDKDMDIIEWADKNIKDPSVIEHTPISEEDIKECVRTDAKTLGDKVKTRYGRTEYIHLY